MPARDVQYTVIYLGSDDGTDDKNPGPFDPKILSDLYPMEDYETPLGLGFMMINLGLCAE